MNQIENPFSLNIRSLALFRIGIGACALIDLLGRLQYLTAHYCDSGVLPRIVCQQHVLQNPAYFSFHYANGAAFFQFGLFLVTVAAAISFIVGYRTRWSALILWCLLLSLHNRNPLILNGGDNALRLFIFWAIWMPIDRIWSIDSRIRSRRNSDGEELFALGNIGLCLQLMFIYLSSGFLKTGDPWLVEHTAVRDSLSLDGLVTPFGIWIRQFDWLTELLTRGTIVLERFAPFALLIPFSRNVLRGLSVTAFVGLHIGIASTMTIYGFSFAMCACWLAFIPTCWWPTIVNLTSRCCPAKLTAFFAQTNDVALEPNKVITPVGLFAKRSSQFAVAILFIFAISNMVLGNLRTMSGGRTADLYPKSYESAARTLGQTQRWAMFAPRPRRFDSWPVISATLVDGSKVNLWNGEPVTFEKPACLRHYLKNRHWRKLITNSFARKNGPIYVGICNYFTREWNRNATDDQRIESVELIKVFENAEIDGPESRPNRKIVWQKDYLNELESRGKQNAIATNL